MIPLVFATFHLFELIEQHQAKGVVVTSPRIPPVVVDRVEEICALRDVAFFQLNVAFEGSLIAARSGGASRNDSGVVEPAEALRPLAAGPARGR